MKSLVARLNKLAQALKPVLRTVITESDTSNAADKVMIIPDPVSLDEWEKQSIEYHKGIVTTCLH